MTDVWSRFSSLAQPLQLRLADVLEARAADPQQRALREAFLARAPFPDRAQVVDIGCGTGALTRLIARRPGIGEVTGVDLAPELIERAQELAPGDLPCRFSVGDARQLPFEPEQFDVATFDSTLCHVPTPEQAIAEARRVLRPGGVLAIFDGDYATTTVALMDNDPLQVCVETMMASSVHDRWLARKLPGLARAAGFNLHDVTSHGYLEWNEPSYLLTVIDRGADLMQQSGTASASLAGELKAEARRRAQSGSFFGFVAYVGVIARKPDA